MTSSRRSEPKMRVVTGAGRVHLAVVQDRARGYYQTLCGMYGEVKQNGWMRPVSWPQDDAREACKSCERIRRRVALVTPDSFLHSEPVWFHVYDEFGVYVGRMSKTEPADLGDLPMERGKDDEYGLETLRGGPLEGTMHIILTVPKGTTWFNESDNDVQEGLRPLSGEGARNA